MNVYRKQRLLMHRSALILMALGLLVVPAAAGDPQPEDGSALVLMTGPIGSSLPAAPADIAAPRNSPVTLREIRGHMQAGDTRRALVAARRYAEESAAGRERDAAWLLVGMLERESGRYNAASEAFTRVRYSGGPLEQWGTYHEAEQDQLRGKPWVAVQECESYRARWPEGRHVSDCLRVEARAWSSMGRSAEALRVAGEYDALHEDAPITEQIELQLAEWRVRNAPDTAVRPLQALATDFGAPLTGRYAEELLAELRAQGIDAPLPDDTSSLQRRAVSLRESGRPDDAWRAFATLTERAEDDPKLLRWVTGEAAQFERKTRQWDLLAARHQAEYDAHPTGDMAWELYRALTRGGRHSEAADVALKAQAEHGTTRRWRYSQEEVATALMLAKRYDEAVVQLDAVARRGGWSGRRGQYEAAFAAYMSGDLDEALARFDRILSDDRSYLTESRYWRARTLQRLDRHEDALQDLAWVLEQDPDSWYAVLVRQVDPLPSQPPFARTGEWPGPALPTFPTQAERALAGAVPLAAFVQPARFEGTDAWSRLSWPLRAQPSPAPAERAPLLVQDLLAPPIGHTPSPWYDDRDAQKRLGDFARDFGKAWPELLAVQDMTEVGLFDLAGPLFGAFYDDWQKALRYRSHPQHHVALEVPPQQEDWRALFLATRDYHHAARFTSGLDESGRTLEERVAAKKLAWPLAHGRYVWAHAREQGIDPFLVLALMRQESTYDTGALSRVGARGAMQIMPRTGHLLADLAHDTRFTAGDLEDPIVAVGYGLVYLGLLMERFEGAYPLAIASYNGGPHNVSSWLQGTGHDMPMDEFVEHIPFRETRTYVKKVSANYAVYLALYAPEGSEVVLPTTPRGDDPSIVDF